MSEINKTAAATAIAISLATLIAMTGSEAAEMPAPQRGYCLLHNHGGADCSFRSKAQCEATAFDQGAECYQDDGEVYLMAMRRPLFTRERWKLGNPAVSISSRRNHKDEVQIDSHFVGVFGRRIDRCSGTRDAGCTTGQSQPVVPA